MLYTCEASNRSFTHIVKYLAKSRTLSLGPTTRNTCGCVSVFQASPIFYCIDNAIKASSK